MKKISQKIIQSLPKQLKGGGLFIDAYNLQCREVTSSLLADSGYGFHNNGFVIVEYEEGNTEIIQNRGTKKTEKDEA